MPRSVSSALIGFGLILFPVKFYTAASAESIKLTMLSPKGNRVTKKDFDAVTGEEVSYEDCDRGYEVKPGEFIRFTKEELKGFEAESFDKIQIQEFVKSAQVSSTMVEKTYYLGPGLGADKAYRLLQAAMTTTKRVGVGQWVSRGKEHLVVIEPYLNGIVLYQMFYSNEIKDFNEITETISTLATGLNITSEEHEMAEQLIHLSSTSEFIPSEYTDRYAARVRKAIEIKVKGEGSIRVPEVEPRFEGVTDLTDLLQRSIDEAGGANLSPPVKGGRSVTGPPTKSKEKKHKKGKKHENGAQQTLGV